MEGGEFRIVSERHDDSAVGGVDNSEPRASKLVSIDRSPQLEHDDEMRLNPEGASTLSKVDRQIAGALSKPTAVSGQVVVSPLRRAPCSGAAGSWIDRLPKPK
jgi:hypothetical protein